MFINISPQQYDHMTQLHAATLDEIRHVKELVTSSIYDHLEDVSNVRLKDASSWLLNKGKMMRPALTLFACGTVCGDAKRALNAGTAIELLHTFTLIHDDVIDNSEFRREAQTVNKKYDVNLAILAGDTLLAKTTDVICADLQLTPEQKVKLLQVLCGTTIRLCVGETMDISPQTMNGPSVAIRNATEAGWDKLKLDYFEMTSLKTGSLTAAAAEVGGIAAAASEQEIVWLSEYGQLFGLAFQLRDDILNISGDEIGKDRGSDIVAGKLTLPIAHFIVNSNDDQRARFSNYFCRGVEQSALAKEELQSVRNLFEETGSIEFCQKFAIEQVNSAKNLLSTFKYPEYVAHLESMADFCVQRTH